MLTKLWFSALKEALKLTAQAQNALDYTMKHAHTEWPSSPVRGAYLRVRGEGMEVHKESAERSHVTGECRGRGPMHST